MDEVQKPSKKGRAAAVGRLRARLDARLREDEQWQIIKDYDASKPNVQTESRATALVLGAILEQALEAAILTHCSPIRED